MFVLGQFCRSELKPILEILEAKIVFLMFAVSTLGALVSTLGGWKYDIFDICIMFVSNSVAASHTIAIDAYLEIRK